MFSMFFGSGNLIFPLAIGQVAQDQTLYAFAGLLLTAVAMPFAGLMAMILFEGNYQQFFGRMGKAAGFAVATLILSLLGPFGVLPRCITLSFATLKTVFPDLTPIPFALGACILVFLFAYRWNAILRLLGLVLTPLLLTSLAILIIKGLLDAPDAQIADQSAGAIFMHGMREGYNTMDLLAAFFFSGVVFTCLKRLIPEEERTPRKMVRLTLQGSIVGAILLGLTYLGFCLVAAYYGASLGDTPADKLLAAIAYQVLGPYAGLIVSIVVSSACLTTAIALTAIAAQFLSRDVCRERISYVPALSLVLLGSFLVSTLEFSGIQRLVGPILQICYPALIVLSIVNIAHKLYGFRFVRAPVYATFAVSLAFYYV